MMTWSQLKAEGLSWIYIGGREEARDRTGLWRRNIRYILNATPTRVDGGLPNYHEKEDTIFTYCRVPLLDNSVEVLSWHYEKAWAFLERARAREDGNVLVHCHLGISRSVSLVCSYMIKYFGYSLEGALTIIREVRPAARPKDCFLEQLKLLEVDVRTSSSAIQEAAPQFPSSLDANSCTYSSLLSPLITAPESLPLSQLPRTSSSGRLPRGPFNTLGQTKIDSVDGVISVATTVTTPVLIGPSLPPISWSSQSSDTPSNDMDRSLSSDPSYYLGSSCLSTSSSFACPTAAVCTSSFFENKQPFIGPLPP